MQNLAVRIALIVITFGTGIVVARTLAPLGRGEQAALAIWPALLSGVSTLGIPIAVSYQSRQRPADAGRLLFAALAVAIAGGSVVAVVGAVAMPILLHGYDARFVVNARWMMLFVPQFLALYVVRAHLEAVGEFTRSIMGQLVPNVFTLASLVALRQSGVLTPTSAVLCYYLPGAVLTLWWIMRLWPRMDFTFRTLRGDITSLLSYGLLSYGADVVNALSAQLDLAIIVAFLNPVALGLYSVSLTVARLLNIVQQSLVTVIFPQASGLNRDSAIVLVERGARLSTSVSILAGVALLIIVPVALPLAYGPAFKAALPIVPFLVFEAILTGLATVLAQAFLSTGRPGVVTLIQAGWLISALSLLLGLVPRMHTTGAAVALAIAAVIRLALVAIAYRLVLGRGLPRLMLDQDDLAFLRTKLYGCGVVLESGTA